MSIAMLLTGCLWEGDDGSSPDRLAWNQDLESPAQLYEAIDSVALHEDEFVFVGELAGEQADPPQAGSFGGAPGHSGVSAVRGTDDAMYVAAVKKNQLMLYRIDETGGTTSAVIADFAANPSLAVDADGTFHLAYFETVQFHLMYATNQSGQWESETVDDSLVPSHFRGRPSLALGPDGEAYISYVKVLPENTEEVTLRYATNRSGNWEIQNVRDICMDCAESNDIFVDGDGGVHLSYCRNYYSDNALIYAKEVDSEWNGFMIITGDAIALKTQLAAANDGTISVLFNFGWQKVKLATYQGGWEVSSPFATLSQLVVEDPSIVVDGTGALHMAVLTADDPSSDYRSIAYMTDISGGWESEDLGIVDLTTKFPSLVLNEAGEPSIFYHEVENARLMLAEKPDDQWVQSQIDRKMNIDSDTLGFALDSNGNAHVVFKEETDGRVFHAAGVDNGWHAEQIASRISHVRFALDSQDVSHVAGLSDNEMNLIYLTNKNGQWAQKILATDCDDEPVAVQVDSTGIVHLFYIRDQKLWYVSVNEGTVSREMLKNFGTFFGVVNMEAQIDLDDGIHLIVDGVWNKEYFHKEAGWPASWQNEPFGGTYTQSGRRISMRVDNSKNIHLMINMKYFTNEAGYWTNENLRDESLTSYLHDGVDMMVTRNGRVIVANSNYDRQTLEIYYQQDDQWQMIEIPTQSLVDGSVRFAFDQNRHLNLVYIGDDAIWYRIF